MCRVLVGLGLSWLLLAGVSAEETAPLTFERDVRPLLKERCFHCHGETPDLQGGLDLRLRRFLAQGGEGGPAIVPGNSADSYLLARLRDREMPPEGSGEPFSDSQLQLIARWIDAGAKTAREEPAQLGYGLQITEEDRQFWAFQPIRQPTPPAVKRPELVENPIDQFVLQRLEEHGLSFAPEADRRTLIRRMSLDLRGLPPTPEEVREFQADSSPLAYQQLIDRLLASPHYGERQGQFWLDLAGYADSEGMNELDTPRLWAWKYRDWVIRSLNADLPWDEFIRQQLAGDELLSSPPAALTPEDRDRLIATGFLRMAPDGTGGPVEDAGLARNQVVADTIEVVTSSLLGLTVKCAQCHEHRYDPIPQADYYRIRAVFEPALDWKNWKPPQQRQVALFSEAEKAEAAKLEEEAKAIDADRLKQQAEFIEAVFQREIAQVPEAERAAATTARNTAEKQRNPEQAALLRKYPSLNVSAGSLYLYDRQAADVLKKLATEAQAIRDRKPTPDFLHALTETPGQLPATFVFARGDHEQPKEPVTPADLSILQQVSWTEAIPENDSSLPTSGRRLAYARQLTSGKHPLVARVLVNRVWLQHFGRGIVETPGDFGQLGARPTHPELLDWLASEFMRQGWSLKQLHRLILTSRTYRQALRTDPQHQQLDPDNTLFGGARLRRLEAETLRDAILHTSGRLNPKLSGAPVPVMANPSGEWVIGIENTDAGRPGAVLPLHGEEFRRSIYVQVRRSRPLAVLETFDRPAMAPNCTERSASTVAPQSLMLLNGTFVLEQSAHLADQLLRHSPEPAKQVERAWWLVYSRPPTTEEAAGALAFLEEQTTALATPGGKQNPRPLALANLCQVLLSSNEFLHVD